MTSPIRSAGEPLLLSPNTPPPPPAAAAAAVASPLLSPAAMTAAKPKSLWLALVLKNPFFYAREKNDDSCLHIPDGPFKGYPETKKNEATFLDDEAFLKTPNLQFKKHLDAPNDFQKMIELLLRLKKRNLHVYPEDVVEPFAQRLRRRQREEAKKMRRSNTNNNDDDDDDDFVDDFDGNDEDDDDAFLVDGHHDHGDQEEEDYDDLFPADSKKRREERMRMEMLEDDDEPWNYLEGYRINESRLILSPDGDEAYFRIHANRKVLLEFAEQQSLVLPSNPYSFAGGSGLVYTKKLDEQLRQSAVNYMKHFDIPDEDEHCRGKDGKSFGFSVDVPTKMRLLVRLLREGYIFGGCGLQLDEMKEKEMLVVSYFPLHNEHYQEAYDIARWGSFEALKDVTRLLENNEHALLLYFGAQCTIYFSFLRFYCQFLIVPAVLGVIFGVVYEAIPFGHNVVGGVFGIIMLIWGTTWVTSWRRAEARFAIKWGQDVESSQELVRDRFVYERKNVVDIKTIFSLDFEFPLTMHRMTDGTMVELQFPHRKRLMRRYLVSYPFILGLAVAMLVCLYYTQDYRFSNPEDIKSSIASSVASVVITVVFGKIFNVLVPLLNLFENARTDTEAEYELIVKSFVFYFVSTYFAALSIMFWPDVAQPKRVFELKSQLIVQLAVLPLVQNGIELILPHLSSAFRRRVDQTGGPCEALCSFLTCDRQYDDENANPYEKEIHELTVGRNKKKKKQQQHQDDGGDDAAGGVDRMSEESFNAFKLPPSAMASTAPEQVDQELDDLFFNKKSNKNDKTTPAAATSNNNNKNTRRGSSNNNDDMIEKVFARGGANQKKYTTSMDRLPFVVDESLDQQHDTSAAERKRLHALLDFGKAKDQHARLETATRMESPNKSKRAAVQQKQTTTLPSSSSTPNYNLSPKDQQRLERARIARQIWHEAQLEPYETTMEDFLELCLQYGFFMLFASAFPWAPVFALLYNILEIRVDAVKLLRFSQRPLARTAVSIGPWNAIFWFLTLLAVVTNTYYIVMVAPAPAEAKLADSSENLLQYFIWTQYFLVLVVVLVWLVRGDVSPTAKKVQVKKELLRDKGIQSFIKRSLQLDKETLRERTEASIKEFEEMDDDEMPQSALAEILTCDNFLANLYKSCCGCCERKSSGGKDRGDYHHYHDHQQSSSSSIRRGGGSDKFSSAPRGIRGGGDNVSSPRSRYHGSSPTHHHHHHHHQQYQQDYYSSPDRNNSNSRQKQRHPHFSSSGERMFAAVESARRQQREYQHQQAVSRFVKSPSSSTEWARAGVSRREDEEEDAAAAVAADSGRRGNNNNNNIINNRRNSISGPNNTSMTRSAPHASVSSAATSKKRNSNTDITNNNNTSRRNSGANAAVDVTANYSALVARTRNNTELKGKPFAYVLDEDDDDGGDLRNASSKKQDDVIGAGGVDEDLLLLGESQEAANPLDLF